MRDSTGRVILPTPRVLELHRLIRKYEQPLRDAIRGQSISFKTAYVGQLIADDYFLVALQITSISKKQVWLKCLTDFVERYPPVNKKAGDMTDLFPEALDHWSYITPEQLKRVKRLKQYSVWIDLIQINDAETQISVRL